MENNSNKWLLNLLFKCAIYTVPGQLNLIMQWRIGVLFSLVFLLFHSKSPSACHNTSLIRYSNFQMCPHSPLWKILRYYFLFCTGCQFYFMYTFHIWIYSYWSYIFEIKQFLWEWDVRWDVCVYVCGGGEGSRLYNSFRTMLMQYLYKQDQIQIWTKGLSNWFHCNSVSSNGLNSNIELFLWELFCFITIVL